MPHIGEHPALPFSGSTPISRHCSHAGAKAAYPKAGSQAWIVFLQLKNHPQTLQELATSCDLPLATICARVGWLRTKGLAQAIGAKKNPDTNVNNTIWATT